MNRRSQAKRKKCSNFYIIKTTNTIPTKFCTVTKTTKSSQNLPHKYKIADGLYFEKNVKCDVSATNLPILMKFAP